MASQTIPTNRRSPATARPVRIVLVNLFYPERHPTIGYPVNVESLVGDLEGEYGTSVDVSLIDMQQTENTVDRVVEAIAGGRFDMVGLSVKTGQRVIAEQILDGVLALSENSRPAHVLVGGYRPRVYHEEFAEKYPGVLVCIGEGEPTMRGMVEHVAGNIALDAVPNLIYMRDAELKRTQRRQHDLTQWHHPGTTSLPFVLRNGGVIYLETSRGCSWMGCTFCSRKFSTGTKPSVIPVEKVADSWKRFNGLGVGNVYCSDEDFLMNNHAHGKALGQALIDADVKMDFWVQTTVDGVLQLGRAGYTADRDGIAGRDINALKVVSRKEAPVSARETLEVLKRAGLDRIFFGLESGSPSQLLRYRKGVTAEESAEAVALCREIGFDVEVGFIPLDPFVTMDELREDVAYLRDNNLARAVVKLLNIMCIQNGVAMFARTKEAGLLTGERDIDTFLYPYRFADPRVEQIEQCMQRWNSHGLSEFTYALRRLVDADPLNPISTEFMMELRDLEFEFFAQLVESDGTKDEKIFDQCMQRRYDIAQRCMTAIPGGSTADPCGFLQDAFEDSIADGGGAAWTKQSETADVLRL